MLNLNVLSLLGHLSFILCFDTFVCPLLTVWLSSMAQNALYLSFSSFSSCFGDSGIDCSTWFRIHAMPSFIRFLFLIRLCFFCLSRLFLILIFSKVLLSVFLLCHLGCLLSRFQGILSDQLLCIFLLVFFLDFLLCLYM